jgi:hypothetical protein
MWLATAASALVEGGMSVGGDGDKELECLGIRKE